MGNISNFVWSPVFGSSFEVNDCEPHFPPVLRISDSLMYDTMSSPTFNPDGFFLASPTVQEKNNLFLSENIEPSVLQFSDPAAPASVLVSTVDLTNSKAEKTFRERVNSSSKIAPTRDEEKLNKRRIIAQRSAEKINLQNKAKLNALENVKEENTHLKQLLETKVPNFRKSLPAESYSLCLKYSLPTVVSNLCSIEKEIVQHVAPRDSASVRKSKRCEWERQRRLKIKAQLVEYDKIIEENALLKQLLENGTLLPKATEKPFFSSATPSPSPLENIKPSILQSLGSAALLSVSTVDPTNPRAKKIFRKQVNSPAVSNLLSGEKEIVEQAAPIDKALERKRKHCELERKRRSEMKVKYNEIIQENARLKQLLENSALPKAIEEPRFDEDERLVEREKKPETELTQNNFRDLQEEVKNLNQQLEKQKAALNVNREWALKRWYNEVEKDEKTKKEIQDLRDDKQILEEENAVLKELVQVQKEDFEANSQKLLFLEEKNKKLTHLANKCLNLVQSTISPSISFDDL